MFYRGRELKRLWRVTLYTGNPDVKKPKTTTETCVAFNAVEAIRLFGSRQVVKQPEAICYVTWPEDDEGVGPIYKIEDTGGPSEEVIKSSLPTPQGK